MTGAHGHAEGRSGLAIDSPSRTFLFAWFWEPGGEGAPVEIRDRSTATAILVRAARSSGDPTRLRTLLRTYQTLPAFGIDDGQIIEHLAAALSDGRLHVWEIPHVPLTTYGDLEEELPPVVAPVKAPVIEEVEPEEEATFSGLADAEQIALVLQQAAATGVPFCEECMKHKAQEEAMFSEDVDAAASAAVLRDAAKSGVPFCEECMKYKANKGGERGASNGGGAREAQA